MFFLSNSIVGNWFILQKRKKNRKEDRKKLKENKTDFFFEKSAQMAEHIDNTCG